MCAIDSEDAGFEKMFAERLGVDADTNKRLMEKYHTQALGRASPLVPFEDLIDPGSRWRNGFDLFQSGQQWTFKMTSWLSPKRPLTRPHVQKSDSMTEALHHAGRHQFRGAAAQRPAPTSSRAQ